MAWATPNYPRKQITYAGRIAAKGPAGLKTSEESRDYWNALQVVNNWRAAHAFPLNTIQIGLRRIVNGVDQNNIVAQRIKRLSSITAKLSRFPTMSLSQMQDIGGCRAIVSDMRYIPQVVERYKKSSMKHKLHTLDNYIEKPKPSGYRGGVI